jgi:hypothetical protein
MIRARTRVTTRGSSGFHPILAAGRRYGATSRGAFTGFVMGKMPRSMRHVKQWPGGFAAAERSRCQTVLVMWNSRWVSPYVRPR